MSKLQKNNLVAQANKLIEARYTITKNEQLLLFAMISLINPNDKKFLTFTTTSDQLALILGIHPATSLREFDKITDRLMSRVIKLNTPTGWEKLQWVSSAKLRGNVISLKFHNDLKPYLLALKKSGNFTQTRLGMVVHFRSVYSIRIYQLLKEYDSKHMNYFRFSLEEFRKIMLGDKSKSYQLFKDFRKKVLNIAKKELEKKDKETGLYKSDLSFDLETQRTGRKISHLKFIIKKQKIKPIKQVKIEPYIALEPENPHLSTPEYKAMQEIGIAEKHALNFLEQYSPAYVSEKLQVLTERQQIEDVISPSGFFIKALEEDWKSEKLAQQQQEDERRTKAEEKRRLEALEKRKHELAYEFGKVIKKEFLASLTKDQEAELLTEIKSKHEGDYFILGDIEKKGLNSMMLAGRIMEMIPNYNARREVYIRENLNKR